MLAFFCVFAVYCKYMMMNDDDDDRPCFLDSFLYGIRTCNLHAANTLDTVYLNFLY